MSNNNYDNWEILVVAVLRREQDRQLALAHSRESSISSSFNFGLDSPVHEQSLQLEASSSMVNERDREILFPSATSSSAGLSRFSAAASDDTYGSGEILATSNLKTYTFADLKFATKNFKPDMILGVGSFGTVFKGWVDPNTLAPSKIGIGMMVVAIQKLNRLSIIQFELEEWQRTDLRRESQNTHKGIQSEVNFLGRLSHPNLVKLHGYCWEDKGLLLVYEFMQRGSLENHLFRGNIAFEPLSWDIRLKIAIGAARGLAFLHTLEKRVICGDFMASNILLDVNYNAKLSNFVLPNFGGSASEEEENSPVSRIVGTYGNGYGAPYGYCVPEYIATGHLYVKSDVYGFGVVLLEILTGLRAIDNNRPSDMKNLVDYAKPFLYRKRKLMSIMDYRMEGQYSSKAALQAAHLVLRCLKLEPKKRPSMKEVGETLEQIAAIGKPNERIQK